MDELKDVDGMTPALYAHLAPLVTVRGTGQINLNSASLPVLRSLPGLGDEAIALIVRAQRSGRPLRSVDELARQLSPGAHQLITDAGADLMQRVTFETREVVVESEGWVSGSPLKVHATAMFARGGDALFTVWRQIER